MLVVHSPYSQGGRIEALELSNPSSAVSLHLFIQSPLQQDGLNTLLTNARPANLRAEDLQFYIRIRLNVLAGGDGRCFTPRRAMRV
jgi:hypothetical protein